VQIGERQLIELASSATEAKFQRTATTQTRKEQMRAFFNGVVLGIILGAVGYWFAQKKAQEHPGARQHFEESAAQFGTNASAAVQNTSDAFRAKLNTLDLNTDEIKKELAHTGEIIRRKAHDIGAAAVNAASDARAVTEIKAKYAMDPNLSMWKISVSCRQGHVILSGTVSSTDDIGKAVALALEADGVRDVASTLRVKPNP
jgi:hyperosmotically inducible periplasmic protein